MMILDFEPNMKFIGDIKLLLLLLNLSHVLLLIRQLYRFDNDHAPFVVQLYILYIEKSAIIILMEIW